MTCGGLCPGLNDVVQGLVRKLEDYGVPDGNILGIRWALPPPMAIAVLYLSYCCAISIVVAVANAIVAAVAVKAALVVAVADDAAAACKHWLLLSLLLLLLLFTSLLATAHQGHSTSAMQRQLCLCSEAGTMPLHSTTLFYSVTTHSRGPYWLERGRPARDGALSGKLSHAST